MVLNALLCPMPTAPSPGCPCSPSTLVLPSLANTWLFWGTRQMSWGSQPPSPARITPHSDN